jgi:hypothetical protein
LISAISSCETVRWSRWMKRCNCRR